LKIQHLNQKLVLGSSSSYRYELLLRLQLPFEVSSPDIDESALVGEMPEATASRLAEEKARAVAAIYPNALIIGADQVAALDGAQLGKPLNYENATKQLYSMRGKEVIFHTALSLLNSCSGRIQSKLVSSLVKFRELSDRQVSNYLAKEQPYHCTGSAKYEGLGIALIERMESDDPNALIGLPLIVLVEMLVHEGVEVV
jgi:septum formation protein